MNEIKQLIRISQFYGSDSRYVIAGGGNTSYKNADKLWVKASGHALATITEEGFAVLDRNKLNVISQKQYPADTAAREEEVKTTWPPPASRRIAARASKRRCTMR
ncbi:MAG: class II aldolase/adducin family protein [Alistipes indistinctus]